MLGRQSGLCLFISAWPILDVNGLFAGCLDFHPDRDSPQTAMKQPGGGSLLVVRLKSGNQRSSIGTKSLDVEPVYN